MDMRLYLIFTIAGVAGVASDYQDCWSCLGLSRMLVDDELFSAEWLTNERHFIFSWDHSRRYPSSKIFDMLLGGFKPVQTLSSHFQRFIQTLHDPP